MDAAHDAGGTIDTGARQGIAQHYALVRMRTVQVEGIDLTMSSSPVTVTVSAEARRPPLQAPAVPEAVVSTLRAAEVDLVWQPVASAVGYRIFRGEGSTPAVLLTRDPVRSLTYADTAVRPGGVYRYSIAAVNQDGESSPRSGESTQHIPCLLYTSPSPRDLSTSRMPSSA